MRIVSRGKSCRGTIGAVHVVETTDKWAIVRQRLSHIIFI